MSFPPPTLQQPTPRTRTRFCKWSMWLLCRAVSPRRVSRLLQKSIPTHLATSAQIETQEDGHIILGLKGDDQPIAAILLSREKTHQILRFFSELAEKAGWGLDNKAVWMEPLRYGMHNRS